MTMNNCIRACLTAALLLVVNVCPAQLPDDSIRRVRAKLQELYPATRIDAVSAAPVAGLYEVVMGQTVVYVEPTARYFLFGRLYDMQTRTDITAARLAEVERIDTGALPVADAIKAVHGNGRRTLYVFADPNCPHCRTLEKSLLSIGDVTVYTFLYPVLSEDSVAKARAVWCAPDRTHAWAQWMERGAAPAARDCAAPIDRNLALGQTLGVRGTPTMFAADGRRLVGAVPAQEIAAWLDRTAVVSTSAQPRTTKTGGGR